MITFRLAEIPIWVDMITDVNCPGCVLLMPPTKKQPVWNRENVKYNDIFLSMFNQEIISCGLPKIFEVNERPDLVSAAPTLVNWKVYEESEQIILSKYKGEIFVRMPHSFPKDDLINLDHYPELKSCLDKQDTIDYSIIFQKVGFQFRVLSIIDHETQLPKPANIIEGITSSLNLPMCKEVEIRSLAVLGQSHCKFGKNYILFMNKVALRISNTWYASTISFLDSIDSRKLIMAWIKYPNRNFGEFFEKIRNIDTSLETKEDLNDIFCAFQILGKFLVQIEAKLQEHKTFEDKAKVIQKLPFSLCSISWDLLNGKSSKPENMLLLYQRIITVFTKEIDKAAA